MEHYRLEKNIPISYDVEVLVIGAGPSGFAAAIASARGGAKTLLIEESGTVGGAATNALVGPFMTSYDACGENQIIRGIFDELIRRLETRGGAIHPSKVRAGTSYSSFISPGHDHVAPFDVEWMKIIAADMVLESGAELLLHTHFLEAVAKDGKIDQIIVADKSGMRAIKAAIIIDCTGDADVAFRAGVPCVLGREKDHKMQPATMFFQVGNVDSEKVKQYIEEHRDLIGQPFYGPFTWLIKEARKKGEWDIARNEIGMYESSTPGEWRINTTRILDVDGTKAEDLTKAEIEGRKQARKVFEFLKQHVPGYEHAVFMKTGSIVGIRETRHIVGDYIITKDDVLNGVIFDDTVMLASNSIDIHADDGEGGEYATVRNGKWYSIPYRSLIAKNLNNLLVAGRAISATSEAVSAFRVMPCCVAIGQAAGVAAALAVKRRVELRKITVSELQQKLKAENVFLG